MIFYYSGLSIIKYNYHVCTFLNHIFKILYDLIDCALMQSSKF